MNDFKRKKGAQDLKRLALGVFMSHERKTARTYLDLPMENGG